VVEHAELNAVWSELLQFAGSTIYIKDARLYGRLNEEVTFHELMEAAHARNEVCDPLLTPS
jgi:hypothetical protein